ncbi:hypothetical protein D187_009469 [Cystobacter fuscus DSM 2262]|uniref:Uncharacterized protein n=1 Tax=Cystobacter fuscus (strain ATCC 25194 / DSM 2262 / NBRC 100088 / M29) TaxID=1242864 RepID=S9NZ07_CYSF2|nr:hypothetical protein D187_009469 [Cystobacter fuscus DSM 2262]
MLDLGIGLVAHRDTIGAFIGKRSHAPRLWTPPTIANQTSPRQVCLQGSARSGPLGRPLTGVPPLRPRPSMRRTSISQHDCIFHVPNNR